MSLLKKLKSKEKKHTKSVQGVLRLVNYFNKLKEQQVLKVENGAIYIYRVLLTLGQSPAQFEKNLRAYAVYTGIIKPDDPLRIIDIETDEILNTGTN